MDTHDTVSPQAQALQAAAASASTNDQAEGRGRGRGRGRPPSRGIELESTEQQIRKLFSRLIVK